MSADGQELRALGEDYEDGAPSERPLPAIPLPRPLFPSDSDAGKLIATALAWLIAPAGDGEPSARLVAGRNWWSDYGTPPFDPSDDAGEALWRKLLTLGRAAEIRSWLAARDSLSVAQAIVDSVCRFQAECTVIGRDDVVPLRVGGYSVQAAVAASQIVWLAHAAVLGALPSQLQGVVDAVRSWLLTSPSSALLGDILVFHIIGEAMVRVRAKLNDLGSTCATREQRRLADVSLAESRLRNAKGSAKFTARAALRDAGERHWEALKHVERVQAISEMAETLLVAWRARDPWSSQSPSLDFSPLPWLEQTIEINTAGIARREAAAGVTSYVLKRLASACPIIQHASRWGGGAIQFTKDAAARMALLSGERRFYCAWLSIRFYVLWAGELPLPHPDAVPPPGADGRKVYAQFFAPLYQLLDEDAHAPATLAGQASPAERAYRAEFERRRSLLRQIRVLADALSGAK